MTRHVLNLERFEVICPDTPHDVLRLAKEERFDAYLLDSWTPGLSGIEICQRIREFDTDPNSFLLRRGFRTRQVQEMAAGAQAYVAHPALLEDLADTIRMAIQDKQRSKPSAL